MKAVIFDKKSESHISLFTFQVVNDSDVKNLQGLCLSVVNGVRLFSDHADCEALQKVQLAVTNLENFLMASCRTAKLWIHYIHFVRLPKIFITAERTCNWNLHLYALTQMLPLFVAIGHNNYTKSSRLFFQIMQDLPSSSPELYKQFASSSNHAIRRSNKAGLSTDLVIE
jgi:hypothetical protein